MVLQELKTCPLCQSVDIFLKIKGNFDPSAISGKNFKITDSNYGSMWTFFQCLNCGFVFSNPTLREEDLIEFYSSLEDKEYSQEADGRAKNFVPTLKYLEKMEIPDKTLLDVGAASGIFMNLAKKHGYQVEGIEPSGSLVEEAKSRYGLNLFKGTVEQFPQSKKFSIITLLDVLEHLTQPVPFMKKIASLVKKDGIVVIVTPDIDSTMLKVVGNRWWHYRVAHVNFFNLTSLTHLLSEMGFEIIKKRRFSWNFSLFYLTSRILPMIKGNRALQKLLKSINFKLQLFDSWEIYARKN